MSKMPAKKKSCFQITSVTQAQVAVSSITDDTESLDDPDESRTEDVSSEIFDSRADIGLCDRSSSEETLNNVGETQEGHSSVTVPVNGGLSIKSLGTGLVTSNALGGGISNAYDSPIPSSVNQPPAAVNAAVPVSSSTVSAGVVHTASVGTSSTSTATCSSRFRVIKLDHGTGEPFRRGRWTCTDFYERDSEGSGISRTLDSIKHAVTLDHNMDRDSGLGATGSMAVPNAAVIAQAQEYTECLVGHQPHPSELQHQGYVLAPQMGGGASAFQPTGYLTTVAQPQQPQVNIPQPPVAQNPPPSGLNGVPQSAMLQKSPIMPPAAQTQQLAYSHPSGVAAGQQDYHQQHFAPLQPQGSSAQNLPVASLDVGPPASQGPSPAVTPVAPGAHGLGLAAHGGEGALVQGLQLQAGGGSVSQQILVSQSQLAVGVAGASLSNVTAASSHSGTQKVPATAPSATNNLTGIASHSPGTGGLAQTHGGAATSFPPGFNNQAEHGGQTSDTLPQASTGSMSGSDAVKPFIPESLDLRNPTVNLFGITIQMDEDEDSTSGASIVAIDNKIEQAMDLVKSHLMYAVREEVEVLKEQIKELYERNSMLERENAVLKSLANSEQLNHLSNQLSPAGSTSPPQQLHALPAGNNNNNNTNTPLGHYEGGQGASHQPNVTSA